MTIPISTQMSALRLFVDWRRRNQRQTPIEEDLHDYEEHLETQDAREKLNAARALLNEPFEAADPNIIERLRGVLQ